MVPGKMGLLIGAMLLCFARSVHGQAVGEDCSGSTTCTDAAAHVCETTGNLCKVKADGTQTDCAGLDGNCPADASCSAAVSGTCSCNSGYSVVASGLCEAIIGLSCANDGECTALDANTECDSGSACACTAGYTGSAGDTCEAIIGLTCTLNTDCTSLDTNTECSSGGSCACTTGYKGVAGETCTAVIGSSCENDAACSSDLANTECVKTSPCTKGLCTCSSGYSGLDCLTLGYQKTCTPGSSVCNSGLNLECPAGGTTCDCTAGNTYKSALGLCTDKKLLGETCTGAGTGDCYTTSNAECDTTCKCSAGYYQDGQACRRPYAGATCTDTCAKVPTISLLSGGESSQQTPTCATTNNKCDCGSDETFSRKIGDTCYTVCLSAYAGTAKAAGVECAAFHECESKVCAQCPDDANPKCYNAPCSGSTISGSILVSSIILLSILF